MGAKFIRIISISLMLFSVLFLGYFLYDNLRDGLSGQIGRFGQSRGLRYYAYDNKIYLNISFQGYYLVPGADSETFESFSQYPPMGKDKTAVYCGSRTIPGLSPVEVIYLGAGYVRNSQKTWYCSREKSNPDYRWWQEFTRSKDENSPERPRENDHLLVEIKDVDVFNLKSVAVDRSCRFIVGYASDGRSVFYEGQVIAPADSGQLRETVYSSGYLKGEPSCHYLVDDTRVYYNGHIIKGVNPKHFSPISIKEAPEKAAYAFDDVAQKYYFGAEEFPDFVDGMDARFLKILSDDQTHADNVLFYNANGIWAWNKQSEQLAHACANPFVVDMTADKRPQTLFPGVWADQENTFVIRNFKAWTRRGKSGGRVLSERGTDLIMLSGMTARDWEKVEDIGARSRAKGAIWKAKGQLYFAPEYGSGQGFEDALYRVDDLVKFKQFIANKKSGFAMRDEVIFSLAKQSGFICRAYSYQRPFFQIF